MNKQDVEKANKIIAEIKELDDFMFYAERVWTGKLTIKDKIMRFVSNSYGCFERKEYNLDTNMKNQVLKVLARRKTELENELHEM